MFHRAGVFFFFCFPPPCLFFKTCVGVGVEPVGYVPRGTNGKHLNFEAQFFVTKTSILGCFIFPCKVACSNRWCSDKLNII